MRAPNINPWAVAAILGLVVAVVAVVLIWVAIFDNDADASAESSPSCANGYVCVWRQASYEGDKAIYPADRAGAYIYVVSRSSIKNRFGTRAVWFYLGPNRQGCVNGGGERSSTPRFDTIWIGLPGQRCLGT